MLEENFQLDTPENVQIDYEVAGIGSRFLATLIDQLWLLLIRGLILLIGGSIFFALDLEDETGIILASLGLILFFLLGWGYYIFFEINWNGQTPGKRQIGLRVVKTNGLPVSASEVIIRNLMRAIDVIPSGYGAGLITMFFTKQSQRLGDLAAGTFVIFEQTEVSLTEVKNRNRTNLGYVEVTERIADMPVEKIKPNLHEMAEDYLARTKTDFDGQAQKMVADQLLSQMYTQMNLDIVEYQRVPNSQKVDFIRQICVRLRELEKLDE